MEWWFVVARFGSRTVIAAVCAQVDQARASGGEVGREGNLPCSLIPRRVWDLKVEDVHFGSMVHTTRARVTKEANEEKLKQHRVGRGRDDVRDVHVDMKGETGARTSRGPRACLR